MKIIDLLVNLNNFNKCELNNMPEIIKYNNKIFYFNSKDVKGYYTEKPGNGGESLFKEINDLNDKVEILEEEPRDIEVCGSLFTKSEYDKLAHSEEEKKIPEKLNTLTYTNRNTISIWNEHRDKINEIIDFLKSKGK